MTVNELVVLLVAAVLVGGLAVYSLKLRNQVSTGGMRAAGSVERISPARAQYGDGQCAFPNCPKTRGWVCSYRDKTGSRCDSRWCDDHAEQIGGAHYCQRHAAVVKALQTTEGSILEVKSQPSLNDRAVPLLNLICEQLDKPVLGVLRQIVDGYPDVQVARQKSVQEVFVDQERAAWQVAYGINNSRGYLLKAALRVGVSEPPVVQAVVANHVVFEDVPYWIKRRIDGQPADSTDHAKFYSNISSAVDKAVRAQVPMVLSQLDVERERFGAVPVPRY